VYVDVKTAASNAPPRTATRAPAKIRVMDARLFACACDFQASSGERARLTADSAAAPDSAVWSRAGGAGSGTAGAVRKTSERAAARRVGFGSILRRGLCGGV